MSLFWNKIVHHLLQVGNFCSRECIYFPTLWIWMFWECILWCWVSRSSFDRCISNRFFVAIITNPNYSITCCNVPHKNRIMKIPYPRKLCILLQWLSPVLYYFSMINQCVSVLSDAGCQLCGVENVASIVWLWNSGKQLIDRKLCMSSNHKLILMKSNFWCWTISNAHDIVYAFLFMLPALSMKIWTLLTQDGNFPLLHVVSNLGQCVLGTDALIEHVHWCFICCVIN